MRELISVSKTRSTFFVFLFFLFFSNFAWGQTTYYSQGTNVDPTVLSNWNTSPIGAGTSPTNFTGNNRVYVVQSGSTIIASTAWSISGTTTKLQVANGGTVIANAAITLSTNTTLQLDAGSTYIHNIAAAPAWGGSEIINATSTVVYGYAGNQAVVLPSTATYGNLTILGGGTKSLGGSTTVAGVLDLQQGDLYIGGNTLTLSGTVVRNGAAAGTIMGASSAPSTSSLTINGSGDLGNLYFKTGSAYILNLVLNRTSSGTASLGSPMFVTGTITLTSGKLQLGDNDLTVTNTGATPFSGTPSASNMIETNGAGSLIKMTNSTAGLLTTFPIGTGSVYSPVKINSLSGTAATGSTFKVRTVAAQCDDIPGINPLERYWVTSTTGITGTIQANIAFTYDPTDVVDGVTATSYVMMYKPTAWSTPSGTLGNTGSVISTTAASSLTATWSATITPPEVYYSFQSGDWNDPNSWTFDPSGTINPGAGVPGAGDYVHIIKGDAITVSSSGIVVKELDIRDGTLDLAGTTGHNFGTVYGNGTLRLTSSSFPGGDFTGFDSATGGTTEFYGATADFQFPKMTFNNLIINLSSNTLKRIVAGTNNALFTVNGNLTVTKGIFQIGTDGGTNTAATVIVDVKNDIVVEANGTIKVGTTKTYTGTFPATGYATASSLVPRYYDIYHKVYIGGNLYNKGGIVKFISDNITYPRYTTLTTEGAATVRFYGLNNTVLQCDGQTDFYNLILDKGNDQTYELNVNAKLYYYFRLFGANSYGGGGYYSPQQSSPGNPELRKALWIRNGTLRLTGYVTIPSLVESTDCNGTPNPDYYIPVNGALVLDSPNVTVISTVDRYQEINAGYNLNLASNLCNITSTSEFGYSGTGCTSFSIYGKLKINDGYFSTRESGGIIFWTIMSGVLEVNGGMLDAKQIRSADETGSGGIASYIQNGGVVQLRGSYINDFNYTGTGNGNYAALRAPIDFTMTTTNGLSGGFGTFNLQNANNVFRMSGGELKIYRTAGSGGIYDNKSQNYQVTGGKVSIMLTENSSNNILGSYPPIYDLDVNNYNNSAGAYTSLSASTSYTPLVVLDDLNVNANARLNNLNTSLTVGSDFNLATGSILDNRAASLIFNGNGTQTFDILGSFYNNTTANAGVNSLLLTNKSNLGITSGNLLVRSSLVISNDCVLNDNGNTISAQGNVTNSGLHQSNGAGSITLNGTGAQVLDGSGDGIYGNLFINKSGGTSTFGANSTVNGELRFATDFSSLNIGSYNLTLGSSANIYSAATGTAQAFNANRMIITSGQSSDGGVTRTWGALGSFLYPVGTAGKYRPATLTLNANPTAWGGVTVRPVNSRHNLLAGTTNALTYYWSVSKSGMTGLSTGAVSWKFDYSNNFATADLGGGTESIFEARIYNPTTWTQKGVASVNETNHYIDLPGLAQLEGDYTACNNTLGITVTAFYSKPTVLNGGVYRWEDAANWSTKADRSDTAPSAPTAGSLVVIGDGATLNHTITVTANTKSVGGLTLYGGSTLDIATTTGHNFGTSITGTGTLRIASNYFPSGDFGSFLSAGGGIVEYYTTTTGYTLNGATLKSSYNRLVLNPTVSTHTITLSKATTTYENFEKSGAGVALIGAAVTVKGDINVNQGRLSLNGAYALQAMSDVNVASTGTFNVTSGTTGSLTIYGNLKNDGIFDFYNSATIYAPVYFKSATNKQISGSGATTDFYTLTVDKGTDQSSILEVVGTNLSFTTSVAQALFINNGTFKVSTSQNLTLTTSADFVIPPSGSLSNNGATLNIGTTGSYGLKLQGKIESLNGTTNIGKDIEYASAGLPEMNIQGGTVNVNGQIRRNTSNTTGSLKYTQSGGDLLIRGIGTVTSRAMFELLNSSIFNTSGGNITIQTAGSGVLGDVYFDPQSSTVTGGSLNFGNASTAAASAFVLYSSVPLWDLAVKNTAAAKSVRLNTVPLVLNGSLTIEAGNVFKANDLDVTIKGSLNNNNTSSTTGINAGGYQASANTTSTQTTYFTGSAGSITGVTGNLTNFANVYVEKSNLTLTANTSNIRINGNFDHKSGTIVDGSNYIDIIGDVQTAGVVQSSSATGGVRMVGSAVQSISDYDGKAGATFGNFIINNSAGRVDLLDNLLINGVFTFTNGIFNIAGKELTLGESSSIVGASSTRYITTNGVNFDLGVVKKFSVGTNSFVYPIGVTNKYTPVTIAVNGTTLAGTVRLRPLNEKHPNLKTAADDQINYYWKVDATGFQGYTANMVFNYLQGDVTGNEAAYVTGRYYNGNWNPSLGFPGTVNSTANTMTLSGVNFLTGDYTAGIDANFDTQDIYYSRQTGPWTDPNTWRLNSPTGPTATVAPNGNQVIIQNNHVVTVLNDKDCSTYSLEIQQGGTLDLGQTWGHNFRVITGGGTIKVTGSDAGQFKWVACDASSFVANPTATFVFTGAGYFEDEYVAMPNVIFEGAGVKLHNRSPLTVYQNLTINNGTFAKTYIVGQSSKNYYLYMYGNWINNVGLNGFDESKIGVVTFTGSLPQTLTSTADESFYTMAINKPSNNLVLNSKTIVIWNLLFQNGIIKSSAGKELFHYYTSPPIVSVVSSYVDGPMQKRLVAGTTFEFPIGKDGRLGKVTLSANTQTASPGIWEAEYYNANPKTNVPSMDPANLQAPLETVSSDEYWRVKGPAGGTSNVKLRWDASSTVVPSDATSRQKLRVAEWNGSSWVGVGNKVTEAAQTVETTVNRTIVGSDKFYTLSVESLPTAIINNAESTTSACTYETATVVLDLTGNPNYAFGYKVDEGPTQSVSGVSTSKTTVAKTGYQWGGVGDHTFRVVNVSDNAFSGIKDFTKTITITVKSTPDPTIDGKLIAAKNELVTYEVHDKQPNRTYAWTVTNGTIQGSSTGNTISVKWSSTAAAGTVSVTETNTTTTCYGSKTINVTLQNTLSPSITTTNTDKLTNVCAGETVVYSTPNVAGHNYTWNVTGGTYTGSGASITVSWGTMGAGVVSVTESATGFASGSDTKNITIRSYPSNSPTVSDPTICNGQTANITIQNAEADIFYQLQLEPAYTNVGAEVNSAPYQFSVSPTASATYRVKARTEYGCELVLTDKANVTVNSNPDGTLTASDADLIICKDASITFSGVAGETNYEFFVDGVSKQSGTSKDYTTTTLVNGNKVKLVVTNSNGCATTSTDKTLTVMNPAGTPGDIAGNQAIVSLPKTEVYTSSGVASPNTYRWEITPAGFGTTGLNGSASFSINWATSGTYTVKVYATNTGCGDDGSKQYTVNVGLPGKPVTPTAAATTICKGTATTAVSIASEATGADPNSYVWSLSPAASGTITGTTTAATITWSAAYSGTASIAVVANNSSGAGPASDPLVITVVGVNPGVIENALGDPYCFKAGDNVVYSNKTSATVSNGATPSYTWEVYTDKNPAWTAVSGATSSTYTVTSMDNGGVTYLKMQFRRVATSGSCNDVSNVTVLYRTPVTGASYHINNNAAQ